MGDDNSRSQSSAQRSIAVVICSTRPSRIGHLIAKQVCSQLTNNLSSSGIDDLRVSPLDLSSHPLPPLNEPAFHLTSLLQAQRRTTSMQILVPGQPKS